MGRQGKQPADMIGGLIAIYVAVFIISVGITELTGNVSHWIPVILGAVVGLWAIQAINKHS